MAAGVAIQVRGLRELQERLRALDRVAGTKTMRSAMFVATKPILDRARATAPRRSGALQLALARTFAVKTRSGGLLFGDAAGSTFSILIGPKTRHATAIALYNLVYRLRRRRRGVIHGHFLEFGTAHGVRATHFLLRALESTSPLAVNQLAAELKKRIEAAVTHR